MPFRFDLQHVAAGSAARRGTFETPHGPVQTPAFMPVGTTTTRALEWACDGRGAVRAVSGEADVFLHPGRPPRVIDGLITNFHLPRSTLLMLVAALTGLDLLLDAYRHAVAERYRFYSYGDAMLIV